MYGDAFSGAQLPDMSEIANTTQLGGVLYTKYAFLFQIAGIDLVGGDDWGHHADIA